MALAAYETWMALEQCEKYRLIRYERSAELVRAALVTGCPYEGVMHTRAMMARVGDDHPSVGGRVVTLEEQEEVMHVMALEQYEKCLAVRIEAVANLDVANTSSLDVANTYNNIAGVYKTQGKYEMALVQYEKCLAIRIKVLGEEHVDVAYTQLNIAEVHCAVDRAVCADSGRAIERLMREGVSGVDWMRCRAITRALRADHPELF